MWLQLIGSLFVGRVKGGSTPGQPYPSLHFIERFCCRRPCSRRARGYEACFSWTGACGPHGSSCERPAFVLSQAWCCRACLCSHRPDTSNVDINEGQDIAVALMVCESRVRRGTWFLGLGYPRHLHFWSASWYCGARRPRAALQGSFGSRVRLNSSSNW